MKIKKRPRFAGGGLMSLSHRNIKHDAYKRKDAQESHRGSHPGLFIATIERVDPALFPGPQHQKARQAGESVSAQHRLDTELEIEPQRLDRTQQQTPATGDKAGRFTMFGSP